MGEVASEQEKLRQAKAQPPAPATPGGLDTPKVTMY